MTHFKVNERDLFFILKEQLNYGKLCRLKRYRELDEDTLDMLVTEAIKFARGVVAPLQEIGESWGVKFEKGRVRCAPQFKEALQRYGENGWIAASRNITYGGQGFPHMMRIVINDQMYGAAQSFNMTPSLTHGAAHLIERFASEELKSLFVPKMYAGRWAGTMCLTEPNAGSNLAAIRTSAIPQGDHFQIKGNKIFISSGDHDLTENIIHLLLARIQGAPDGVKGISLFIVPKIQVHPDGSLGEPNDVVTTAVEDKMGLHASPTCALNFGDNEGCIGYLCGEPNRGLSHMFQMMNQARINTGVTAMTLASLAYQHALSYARERVQGHDVAGRKTGYVPIIDHPDVRRVLLWMKSTVDGMRSMIYTGAFWSDLALEMEEGEERIHYQELLDFMTPIIKAYCSDLGFQVCERAVQVLGGYGYCREYHVEQYLRDAKIASIYEGTNGIQSMDLMGRKMRVRDGAPFRAYRKELEIFVQQHGGHPVMGETVRSLGRAAEKLFPVADGMAAMSESDPLQWASHTYPMLLCFGDVTMVWRLLDMARVAQQAMDSGGGNDFYLGKVLQAKYYADVTLPICLARLDTCLRRGREILEMPEEAF